jgi:hypothetical protein
MDRNTAGLLNVLGMGLLLHFASGSGAFGADPGLMNLVMPDAKALAGLNATAARISPLGQFILSKAPGTDANFQAFIDATGFDPRQDLIEVLAASVGDPANPGGLLLLRGNFQPDKIAAFAGTKQPAATVGTYDGATLITATSPKEKVPHGVAFIGTTIAVAGDLASVKAALDRSKGSNSIDTALAVKVNTLSTSQDAWFVNTVPAGSFVPANAQAKGPGAAVLPVLKSIQSSSGGVQLGSNVQISAEAVASDAQNAASLAAVLQLLKALAGSNAQLQNALQFIQEIQVTTNGDAVDLALSVPESQLESLVNSLPKAQAKAAQSPQTRPRRQRTPPAQQN